MSTDVTDAATLQGASAQPRWRAFLGAYAAALGQAAEKDPHPPLATTVQAASIVLGQLATQPWKALEHFACFTGPGDFIAFRVQDSGALYELRIADMGTLFEVRREPDAAPDAEPEAFHDLYEYTVALAQLTE